MSAATKSPFVEALVAKKPILLCIGYVDEVGECKESESGQYLVQKIHIAPVGPGRGAYPNFLFRPEWLRPGYDPKSLSSVKGGDKMLFVYRNNIAGYKSTSVLKGLSGSEERYAELASRLQGLATVDPESVQATLKSFLVDEVQEDPVLIGYDLVQGKDDTGETDDKGKKIKVLNDRYEVGDWWFATEENKKKKRAAAAASAKNLKEGERPRVLVAFEEEDAPF
jgi:hypothetical protein